MFYHYIAKFSRVFGVGAALLAAALGSVPALASSGETVHGPIVVTRAFVEPTHYTTTFHSGESAGISTVKRGELIVTYRNISAIEATHVTFEFIKDNRSVARATDVGKFSPGVSISHRLSYDSDVSRPTLHIAEVRFADGSVWRNPIRALP